MSLIYRLKRLVKSDLHAFVEGMEEKKWVLAQALRDMEEELEKLKTEIEIKMTQEVKVADSIEASEKGLQKIEADIDFAMKEKREEIAKSLIKKMILTRQNLDRFKKEEAQVSQELEKLKASYQSKKQSYDEIVTRSEGISFEKEGDDIFKSASQLISEDSSLQHQVEIEFLRRLDRTKEAGHEN
jgi:phage shock protein A